MVRTAGFWVVIALVILGTRGAAGQSPGYRNPQLLVETQELATFLRDPDLRLLDARPAQQYRSEHLPGAVNLPAPATDDLDSNRRGLPVATERAQELFRNAGVNTASRVVVYDEQGNRFAARVFYVLEFFGHQRVQVLNGGIAKWRSEGRVLTPDEPRVARGDFNPVPHPEMIATAEWVAAHIADPQVRLVDARSPAEYGGASGASPASGHIPGAVNIEWTRLITPGEIATFLGADQLARLFTDAQVTPEKEVAVYCQVGMRAAEAYFALRLLGYERVRMYDASWAEWGTNAALPVEK